MPFDAGTLHGLGLDKSLVYMTAVTVSSHAGLSIVTHGSLVCHEVFVWDYWHHSEVV